MQPAETGLGAKVAYVLKVYPRFSETFIVNELLAHEAAGLAVEIVSLRTPTDGRFHAALAEVRAPVTYLPSGSGMAAVLWQELRDALADVPGAITALPALLAADPRDAFQALVLARHIAATGITHLHAHFASVATTVARLAARAAGITYSFTAHAKDIFHESVDPADLRAKLADARSVVTVSDFNVTYLRAGYGAEAARVTRVYNGLDLDVFTYRAPVAREPLVVAVGRLVEKKGFGHLIDAIALLRDHGRDVRCVIAGAGEHAATLAARCAAHGVADLVTLPGALPQHRVRELLASAAVFAAPCVVGDDGNRDGLPTVLLEAMALGTPCVATDVTGIPEVLRDGDTGLSVPQHDPEALGSAIVRLLDDQALRVRLAAAARALVERDFDVHRQAAGVRDHFAPSPMRDVRTEAPTFAAVGA